MSNYDPNPEKSEVKGSSVLRNLEEFKFEKPQKPSTTLQQKVVEKNGVQKIVTVQVETVYPGYEAWLKDDDSIKLSQRPKVLGPPTTTLLGFNCAAAGYGINCKGTRCKAHIITQQVLYLRSDKKNILEVCKAHETYFNKQPLKEWYHFVKRYYKENFKYVYERMQDVHQQLNSYLEVIKES